MPQTQLPPLYQKVSDIRRKWETRADRGPSFIPYTIEDLQRGKLFWQHRARLHVLSQFKLQRDKATILALPIAPRSAAASGRLLFGHATVRIVHIEALDKNSLGSIDAQ